MILDGVKLKIERTERRKTLSIFIERDGSVRVLAPQTISDEKLREAVESKQYQIFTKLAKWKELNNGKINREFVNGQSFLYLGRNYRLSIIEDIDEPLKFSNNRFFLDKRYLKTASKLFETFYRMKAEEKITERIKDIQPKFSERPSEIKIMELNNRWASCSPKGGLNFNWKCVMAPVSIIDYIITHEMVHLRIPNHSPEFWNELDKKMPNYREHYKWLKKNGVKMDL